MFGVLCALMALELASMKSALVVTHTAGYRHDSIETAERVIASLGESSREYRTRFARTSEEVVREFSAESLAKTDLVVFANTSGNIGIPDLGGFLDWVRAGGAVAGMHAAVDTNKVAQLDGDSRFIDLFGAEFGWHGHQCEVTIQVDVVGHPATEGLDPEFRIFDEIYHFVDNDPSPVRKRDLEVLLSMNTHPMDGGLRAGQPGDYPVAWVREEGKGRVFYTSLGHRIETWEDPRFQQHILGGMLWALRRR